MQQPAQGYRSPRVAVPHSKGTARPPCLAETAVEALKGFAGMSHNYTLRNETTCTVKVLLYEDPEALKTVARAKGGLNADFFSGAGNIPVGLGGQAALQANQGQRKQQDLTVQPKNETQATASTSTVFTAAAFWQKGSFKFLWENRSLEAGSTICFLQRHFDDASEAWITASSLREALHRKQGGLPMRKADLNQLTVRPDRPRQILPTGFLDVTRLTVWSQTCRAFIPGEVLGVAQTPGVDSKGQPFVIGSVALELEYPDGTKFFKVVHPESFAQLLKERPPAHMSRGSAQTLPSC